MTALKIRTKKVVNLKYLRKKRKRTAAQRLLRNSSEKPRRLRGKLLIGLWKRSKRIPNLWRTVLINNWKFKELSFRKMLKATRGLLILSILSPEKLGRKSMFPKRSIRTILKLLQKQSTLNLQILSSMMRK